MVIGLFLNFHYFDQYQIASLYEAYKSLHMKINHHHNIDPGIERILERLLHTLTTQGENIMTAISDFAAKMNSFNDRQDKAVADLQGDVKSLEDQIAALQASPGTITPEDQTSLDNIQARASTISDKLDALDNLTPPVAPAA